jgi:hypothetical protein
LLTLRRQLRRALPGHDQKSGTTLCVGPPLAEKGRWGARSRRQQRSMI